VIPAVYEETIAMKAKYVIPVVLLFFFLSASPISKGEIPGGGDQVLKSSEQASLTSTDREIWEMIDVLREFHLIKELELPEDRAKRLLEKMRFAKKIKQRYLFQRYQIETQLDALLDFPHPDQAQLNAALKELEVAKMQYYQLTMEADHELQMILSPEEQARYVLFQKNFNKKLKEIIVSIRQQRAKTAPKQNFLLRRQDGESVIREPH
jgi:Spy/CpxP family protein refolding chaperone